MMISTASRGGSVGAGADDCAGGVASAGADETCSVGSAGAVGPAASLRTGSPLVCAIEAGVMINRVDRIKPVLVYPDMDMFGPFRCRMCYKEFFSTRLQRALVTNTFNTGAGRCCRFRFPFNALAVDIMAGSGAFRTVRQQAE